MRGAGYAYAKQVNVALSRPLTVLSTGPVNICGAAVTNYKKLTDEA